MWTLIFVLCILLASREPPFSARQLIIARLGRLTSLNNSEVCIYVHASILDTDYKTIRLNFTILCKNHKFACMHEDGLIVKHHVNLQVSLKERQASERYYIKRYAQDWINSRKTEESKIFFSTEHPRLIEGKFS